MVDDDAEDVPLEYLEREICTLAAQIAAATCRWLSLLAAFDRRQGWSGWGLRSCAHWLNWRCGMSLVAARDHVRVAHRLAELPLVRAAFAAGQLSYSKVRALTRMAAPATEAELVDLARHATAAHLERLARAYRRVGGDDEVEAANERHDRRYVRWCFDDDGSFVLAARLSPEEGAVVLQALAAARHALRRGHDSAESRTGHDSAESRTGHDSAESRTGHDSAESRTRHDLAGSTRDDSAESRSGDDSAESPAPTAADALVAMAETVLEHGPAARDGGERYQVVVLVDDDALQDDASGTCRVEDGPALAPETARRLACDAGVVAASLGEAGEPLDVGRRTRSIPPAIRRALVLRDGGCRFPGCTQRRFVDGHHIRHWAQGGATSLANLVLLCRAHHRAVHEGGYAVVHRGRGAFSFTRPDGRLVPTAPQPPPVEEALVQANQRSGLRIEPDAGRCLWGGERLDVGLAIDALLCLEDRQGTVVTDASSSR